MADDMNTNVNEAPSPETSSTTPPAKKARAPRQPKAAAVAASTVMKNKGGRPRKAESKTATAPATPDAVAKSKAAPVKAKVTPVIGKRGPQKAKAATTAADDFSDLIKLEEENQKLRKSLAEKLRKENSDLRKKLGLA